MNIKNLNNPESKVLKSTCRQRLAANFIGVVMILFFVLGCSSLRSLQSGDESANDNNTTFSSDKKKKTSSKNLPLKETIIGEWEGKMQGRTTTIKFTSDGRITLGGEPARYKVLDEETIATADGGDENYNEKMKVKVVGDTLTLSQPSGKQVGEFTRVGGNDSSEGSGNEESSNDRSDDSTDVGETTKDRRFRESFGTLAAQFYRANRMVDTAEMERILADDFTVVIDGETVNKRELIKGSERDKTWVSSQAKDTRFVTKEENRVVVEYKIILEYTDKTTTETCQSEFVKSNEWQLRKAMPCTDRVITKK